MGLLRRWLEGDDWITDLRRLSIRSEKIMLKALLCKLNIQHDWHIEHTEDGAVYKRCKRCGKDDDSGGGGAGSFGIWAGPAGG